MANKNPDFDGASLGLALSMAPRTNNCAVLGFDDGRRWNHRWIFTWRNYCRRAWRCGLGTVGSGLGEFVGGAVGSGFGADVGLIVGLGLGGDVGAELDLSSDLGSVET